MSSAHNETTDPSQANDSQVSRRNSISPNRWNQIHLGLVQQLIIKVFKGISSKYSLISTAVVNILLSIIDTASDLWVVYFLYTSEEYGYALLTLFIDYIPGWQLALHNGLSKKWRQRHSKNQIFMTIVYLIVSPFSLPLFMIQWLWKFESSTNDDFEMFHHNAKLSQLLNGALESPAQITLLLMFWGKNKLMAPWNNPVVFLDLEGNIIDLGPLPGILSLLISCCVIVKGVLDLAGKLKNSESMMSIAFICSNAFFRITSFALSIMFFNFWDIILFVVLFVVNFICIFRYDAENRRGISVYTSSYTAIFTPFVAYEDTHWMDVASSDNNRISQYKKRVKNRRNLAASLSLKTLPLILLTDVLLLLLLLYSPDFKYNEDIQLCKPMTIKILWKILIPCGFAALISSACLHKDDKTQYDDEKKTKKVKSRRQICKKFGMTLSLLMFTISIGFGLSSVVNTNCNETNQNTTGKLTRQSSLSR